MPSKGMDGLALLRCLSAHTAQIQSKPQSPPHSRSGPRHRSPSPPQRPTPPALLPSPASPARPPSVPTLVIDKRPPPMHAVPSSPHNQRPITAPAEPPSKHDAGPWLLDPQPYQGQPLAAALLQDSQEHLTPRGHAASGSHKHGATAGALGHPGYGAPAERGARSEKTSSFMATVPSHNSVPRRTTQQVAAAPLSASRDSAGPLSQRFEYEPLSAGLPEVRPGSASLSSLISVRSGNQMVEVVQITQSRPVSAASSIELARSRQAPPASALKNLVVWHYNNNRERLAKQLRPETAPAAGAAELAKCGAGFRFA